MSDLGHRQCKKDCDRLRRQRRIMLTALRKIKWERDAIANGQTSIFMQDQCFDDWAADLADAAIEEARLPKIRVMF